MRTRFGMRGPIRTVVFAALVPTLAVALTALPARADDADAFKAAVTAANANIASLVVDMTMKQGAAPASIHEVVVFPDRLSITMNAGAMTLDTRIIGDMAYVNMPGSPGPSPTASAAPTAASQGG
jgi:hypothetical protein